METRKINFLVILVMAVLLLSCSSDDDSGVTPKDKPDIFIVGEADEKATLWKNGEIIEQKEESSFESVFVAGDNVYIGGGNFRSGDFYAKLWQNGEAMNIEGGTNPSRIRSVYIDNDQIYAIGNEYNSDREKETKLWKNGVATTIGDRYDSAQSLFVHNNDVYVVVSDDTSTLLKNSRIFFEGYRGSFKSVFVTDDNDVYLAGTSRNDDNIRVATIWKNGEPQELSDIDSDAEKVVVYNNDVYVIGVSERKAKLWKNGVDQNIIVGTKDSYATDVFVYNNDVYVVGHEIDDSNKLVATLWINGEPQKLTTNTSERSRANSIFIR